MKLSKKFLMTWAMYPIRRLVFKHWKALLVLLAVLLVAVFTMVKPMAAEAVTGVTVDMSDMNGVAAAISENAQVIENFVEQIDVEGVSVMASEVKGLIDATLGGAPTIIITVGIFFVVLMVLRKVIGR